MRRHPYLGLAVSAPLRLAALQFRCADGAPSSTAGQSEAKEAADACGRLL